jgi:hypothetical protein
MIEAAHEFDDDAYTEAVLAAQASIGRAVEALWKAGANGDNLSDELSNAIREALAEEGVEANVDVSVWK